MRNPYEVDQFADEPDWRDNARCKGKDVNLFFAKPGTPQAEAALNMCEGCPVRFQCAQDALSYDVTDDHGIRGGLTEGERRRIRKEMVA